MYLFKDKKTEKIEHLTFTSLEMTKNDLEEIFRQSIEMLEN